jgi:hypothetical protein
MGQSEIRRRDREEEGQRGGGTHSEKEEHTGRRRDTRMI